MHLIDIYRIFHSKSYKFIFFLTAYKTFLKIDHILDHDVLANFKIFFDV